MKTGLIMEGGAMRGMFTCGVTDVMMEKGITFDGAVGVSAGAVFGCNVKSGQIGRAIRYNKKYCGDKRYASFHSLRHTGNLFGVEFCYHTIPEELDPWDYEAYKENPMEFYVTCTDVETGKPVYHKCETGLDQDIEWLRASASLPMLSTVVEIDGQKLLDGGIADSIPLRFFEEKGYDRNVVILTRPMEYVKKKTRFIPLARVMLRKYPNMIKAMADRHVRYNETVSYIRQKEEAGEVFVIRPPESLNIGKMEKNPAELERVYQVGRSTALQYLDQLTEFLQ